MNEATLCNFTINFGPNDTPAVLGASEGVTGSGLPHRIRVTPPAAPLDFHGRDAVLQFPGEFVERDRVLGEPARFEDAPLAIVEHGDRRGERDAAVNELLARDERRLLVGTLVDQPVLPLAEIAVLADRRVERGVAGEPAWASRRAMI